MPLFGRTHWRQTDDVLKLSLPFRVNLNLFLPKKSFGVNTRKIIFSYSMARAPISFSTVTDHGVCLNSWNPHRTKLIRNKEDFFIKPIKTDLKAGRYLKSPREITWKTYIVRKALSERKRPSKSQIDDIKCE